MTWSPPSPDTRPYSRRASRRSDRAHLWLALVRSPAAPRRLLSLRERSWSRESRPDPARLRRDHLRPRDRRELRADARGVASRAATRRAIRTPRALVPAALSLVSREVRISGPSVGARRVRRP